MHKANRSLPLGIFLLWWCSWLIIHNTPLTPTFTASIKTQLYFVLMFIMVTVGYVYAYSYLKQRNNIIINDTNIKLTKDGKITIAILLIILFFILIMIGLNTDAFKLSPSDYHSHIRGKGGLGSKLAPNKYIDILMGLLFYPIMFSIWIFCLVSPKSRFNSKCTIFVVFIHVIYSYIYQVNYAVAAMSFTFFIYLFFFKRNQNKRIPKKTRKLLFRSIIVFGVLMSFAAATRFGSYNLIGIFKKYVISYHTLGFYFFDVKLHDSESILHSMSYGRSVLGWFDSIFDLIIRFFKEDMYTAANLENRNDNMKTIFSGIFYGREVHSNAFGTILFTMYRDFKLLGIVIYSFLYGVFLAYSYSKSNSIKWKAIFIILFFAGIESIGVSVVERPFFWFSIIFIFFAQMFFIREKKIAYD